MRQYPLFQSYLTKPTADSPLDPLTNFLPLTTHQSPVRRLGAATLLRNLTLAHPDPLYLLQPASSILTPILLPLCDVDQAGITPEEMETLPEECQYLVAGEHVAETDSTVLSLLLEALYLVIARSGSEGRRVVRSQGAYPIVRELHLRNEEESVRKACEKVVDVLMAEEADHLSLKQKELEGGAGVDSGTQDRSEQGRVVELEEDEDNEIVPIF